MKFEACGVVGQLDIAGEAEEEEGEEVVVVDNIEVVVEEFDMPQIVILVEVEYPDIFAGDGTEVEFFAVS